MNDREETQLMLVVTTWRM